MNIKIQICSRRTRAFGWHRIEAARLLHSVLFQECSRALTVEGYGFDGCFVYLRNCPENVLFLKDPVMLQKVEDF